MRVPSCDQIGSRSSNGPQVSLRWFDAVGRDRPEVVAAVAVGEEGDRLAVGRPRRLARVVEDVGDARRRAAGGRHASRCCPADRWPACGRPARPPPTSTCLRARSRRSAPAPRRRGASRRRGRAEILLRGETGDHGRSRRRRDGASCRESQPDRTRSRAFYGDVAAAGCSHAGDGSRAAPRSARRARGSRSRGASRCRSAAPPRDRSPERADVELRAFGGAGQRPRGSDGTAPCPSARCVP